MRDDQPIALPLSHEAFSLLVDLHQHRLYAFLLGLLGNSEQAFDLVQETFLAAWRSTQRGDLPFVEGIAHEETQRWLFRVGYHQAISLLRRRRIIRWESLDTMNAPEILTPDVTISFDDLLVESDALQTALAQMNPQDVAYLLLRVVYGLSAAEVGLITHTSADNVNTRLARAKQRLRVAYFKENRQIEERHRP